MVLRAGLLPVARASVSTDADDVGAETGKTAPVERDSAEEKHYC